MLLLEEAMLSLRRNLSGYRRERQLIGRQDQMGRLLRLQGWL